MSGICGLFHLDGSRADVENIRTMLARIKHRGPDGTACWSERHIALGHNLLYNTPESFYEQQPLTSRGGNLVITADARIDNREELFSSLYIEQHLRKTVTDPELILCAYEKWGSACAERLLGDFAFAIWDKNEQRLFCTRDHMGIKPFYYYHVPGKFFVFASEVKALLSLQQVAEKVNEEKIADYFIQLGNSVPYETSTFYENIYSLSPASYFIVTSRQVMMYHYWKPEKKEYLELNTEEDYVSKFKELFHEAVKCRLRTAYPVSATLSGGLDSSSVSCVSRNFLTKENKTLHTIYTDCQTTLTDEQNYVTEVLKQGGFIHTRCHAKSPVDAISAVTDMIDRPLTSPFASVVLANIMAAHENKSRVLLTGYDGDTVVSRGREYLTHLLLTKQFKELKTSALQHIRNTISANSMIRTEKQLLLDRLYPAALAVVKKYYREARFPDYIQTFYHLTADLPFSSKNLLGLFYKSILVGGEGIHTSINPFIHKDFSRQYKVNERLKALKKRYLLNIADPYAMHASLIQSNAIINACERQDHIGAGFGLEVRHPFFDKRLIEICLSAPLHLKYNNGYGRGLLRRSMEAILPKEIQNRKTKIDFTYFLLKSCKTVDKKKIEELLFTRNHQLSIFVQKNLARNYFNDFYFTDQPLVKQRFYCRSLLNTVYLSIWLTHTKN